jgi:hypothetical protein
MPNLECLDERTKQILSRTKDREIEITPEMIEAGTRELCAFALDPDSHSPEETVITILSAALATRPRDSDSENKRPNIRASY